LLLLGVASGVAVNARGILSRIPFYPSEEFRGARWALVGDAATAVELWSAAGLRGRRVLVASGRWGKPPPAAATPAGPSPGASAPEDRIGRVGGALYDATMRGLARELTVVMPRTAFEARIEALRSSPETTLGDGWARQPFHGIPRSFHRPSTLPALDEVVLVLVEPSFFEAGAPPDLPAWLESQGVRFDLALIAAWDPEATPAQLELAQALAARVGAIPVEVDP
jgi:hypothetical protein